MLCALAAVAHTSCLKLVAEARHLPVVTCEQPAVVEFNPTTGKPYPKQVPYVCPSTAPSGHVRHHRHQQSHAF